MNKKNSEASPAVNNAVPDVGSPSGPGAQNDEGCERFGETAYGKQGSGTGAEVTPQAGAGERLTMSREEELVELERLMIEFFGSDP